MNFLIMLAAMAMLPRLLGFLSGRNQIRVRTYEPLGARLARWGCLEWGLLALAVLVAGVLHLFGVL